jgi:alkylation response protein AidB-like acyl-CoA dehydrogenase
MAYDFDGFRTTLSDDWFTDDPLLGRLLDRFAPGTAGTRVAAFGPVVAGHLRNLAHESARPENKPLLRHRDAYGEHVDEVVLPPSTLEALRLTLGDLRLGAVQGDPFAHYAMIYLLAQNGEAGVACSLACTDGLARALTAFGDGDMQRTALDQVRSSDGERYVHAAQFVTEIQGGSDVRANRTRAVPDGDRFRLHGEKWFCSNINADWFLVTAVPAESAGDGDDQIGLFLVPAWKDADPTRGRNGYRIERLKDKLGTLELATAEVTFDGAAAWPVGPVDQGLRNLLRYVLVPSRFACVLFGAAAQRQAERLAEAYAGFREAFGRPIDRYPLVARSLDAISASRARSLACVFEILRLWEAAEAGKDAGPEATDFRILLSLAKPAITRQATGLLHDAMMLLGGNGIEERFSPLPRLFRDSVIMETWEGPHSVLHAQALRDLVRLGVEPRDFVARVAGPDRADLADRLSGITAAAAGGDEAATIELADLGPELVLAVGERVLSELDNPQNA